MSKEEALKLAESMLDYRANMVNDAIRLARYIVEGGDANGLLMAKARVVELETHVQTLGQVIDEIASSDPDSRDQKVAAAVTARKACQ